MTFRDKLYEIVPKIVLLFIFMFYDVDYPGLKNNLNLIFFFQFLKTNSFRLNSLLLQINCNIGKLHELRIDLIDCDVIG